MAPNPAFRLPTLFAERMKNRLGSDYNDFVTALQEEPPVAVRINPSKWETEPVVERVPWCNTGYYLSQRPLFTADPWFQGGAYYVQEPSSMFLEQAFHAVHLPGQATVLDLCAAPGGKTTHLLSLLKPDDLLVSNEVIRSRVASLLENVQKWGYPNVMVTQNDPQDFERLKNYFDLVIVDVPCSGEGLFRKDHSAMAEWSPENALHCAARQKRIVAEAWKCLKPGGYLIYSTCTFNPGENEENIRWLTDQSNAEGVEININPDLNIETIRSGETLGYQFFPHRTKGEGFFISTVRKSGNPEVLFSGKPYRKGQNALQSVVVKTLRKFIIPDIAGEFLLKKKDYCWFPASRLTTMAFLENKLNVIQSGVPVASGPENRLTPHPALVYSQVFNRSSFPDLDVNLSDAIRFLQKEVIQVNNNERGWMVVSYRDIPLGWMKNLGNRANNYFPGERRIRMAISGTPELWHEKAAVSSYR